MVEHKMVVIDDVRYRLEDAKERGLVDAAGKPTRKARVAKAAANRQRVTGDEALGSGGSGGDAGSGASGSGGDGKDGGNGGQGDGSS